MIWFEWFQTEWSWRNQVILERFFPLKFLQINMAAGCCDFLNIVWPVCMVTLANGRTSRKWWLSQWFYVCGKQTSVNSTCCFSFYPVELAKVEWNPPFSFITQLFMGLKQKGPRRWTKNRMNGTSAEVFQSLTFQIYRHSKTLTYHRQRAPNRLLMNMNTYWLFIEYR